MHEKALFDIWPKIFPFEADHMKQLVRIYLTACKTIDILTSARGGSLFGAIRHHGFIPWDDDLTLCLTCWMIRSWGA